MNRRDVPQELGKQPVSVNASFVKRWTALFDGSLVTVGCYSTQSTTLTAMNNPCQN
jgi:hypothetical protein